MAHSGTFPIVGIGASAGGVEALQVLFRAMPASPAMDAAFIVVTHLGPGRESALPQILQACTTLPIVPAADDAVVQPGHVYVLQTGALITMADGRIVLRPQAIGAPRERQLIDLFFVSLAHDQGERAVGIVLSGSGSDGTLGLKAIKEHGGFTLAQGSNGTAPRYTGMPNSATAGGAVDLVLPAEEMPAWLSRLSGLHGAAAPAPDPAQPGARAADAPDPQAAICEILRTRIGHDFSGYKSKTFFRRVQRRMLVLLLRDIDTYIAFLRDDPDEAGKLFRDLLISVTGFFRDPASFEALASRVMPAIFEGRGADETVRIWVPGCATGEEAYSLAILASEQAALRPGTPAVQIFATDIDEAALGVARRGRYPAQMMSGVSPERLARFFEPEGETCVVTKALRELCVFSLHNLIRDAPFSRIDLVSCRNLLIYMGGELQEQVIPLFHYALRPSGFLFLGVSETVSKHADLFAVDDKLHRIYRRRDTQPAGLPLQINTAARGAQRNWQAPSPSAQPRSAADLRQMAASFAAEQLAPPHLLVNRDGNIVYQSANLGAFLEPSTGVPSRQLVSLARLALRVDLRAALRDAMEKRQRIQRPPVEMEVDGRRHAVTVTVAPLPPREGFDAL